MVAVEERADAALAPAARASYERDGYLVVPSVFTAREVAAMRADADFILELIVNSSLANQRHSRRLDIRRQRAGNLIVRKIQPINDLALALAEISADPRLLGPMAELMGDEPMLMEEKLNYKQPLPAFPGSELFRTPVDDDRFPIHNDWAYYRYNDYPRSIISSAITIDESRADNGPIQVFPGTHKRHVDHLRVRNGLEVPPGTVDAGAAVPLIAPAGSVMFFHSCLIHTSAPNDSGAPRRLMIYSHFPKAAAMGFDIRNGPARLGESPWEWRYQRLRAQGAFVDRFRLNSAPVRAPSAHAAPGAGGRP